MGFTSILLIGFLVGLGLLLYGLISKPRTAGKVVAIVLGILALLVVAFGIYAILVTMP